MIFLLGNNILIVLAVDKLQPGVKAFQNKWSKCLCCQCNNGYKNKSSLRRHINSVHNNRKFVCGHCQKEYMRKVDFVKHTTKYHQPIILNQGPENIDVTQITAHARNQPTNCLKYHQSQYLKHHCSINCRNRLDQDPATGYGIEQ